MARIRRRRLALTLWLAAVVIGSVAFAGGAGGASVGDLAFDNVVFKDGGAEPTIAISPTGRVVMVAALHTEESPATLYRSTDFGRTFKLIKPTFSDVGGSDWDMTFLDDHTIVAVDLSLGSGMFIHRSEDDGTTWTTTSIAMDQYDRPWIAHYGRDLVYVAAKGFDGIPYLYRSTDGGRSFGTPPLPIVVYGLPDQGGPDPLNAFVYGGLNAYLDHLVVDQSSGDVYVMYGLSSLETFNPSQPLGVSNQLFVAHLEGDRMISYPIHLGEATESAISGFNWMTVDGKGTVYALVNGRKDGHHSARLSFSKDHGRTWSSLVDVAPPGAANVFGSIAAGDAGVLSLVYLRGKIEDPNQDQEWYGQMARITRADTSTPAVTHVRTTSKPMHLADICFDGIACGLPGFGDNRDLLDFIWNEVSPTGKAFAVISSDGPATGFAGDANPDVVIMRQKAGPAHRAAAVPPAGPAVGGKKTAKPRPSLPATGAAGAPIAAALSILAGAVTLATVLRRAR